MVEKAGYLHINWKKYKIKEKYGWVIHLDEADASQVILSARSVK